MVSPPSWFVLGRDAADSESGVGTGDAGTGNAFAERKEGWEKQASVSSEVNPLGTAGCHERLDRDSDATYGAMEASGSAESSHPAGKSLALHDTAMATAEEEPQATDSREGEEQQPRARSVSKAEKTDGKVYNDRTEEVNQSTRLEATGATPAASLPTGNLFPPPPLPPAADLTSGWPCPLPRCRAFNHVTLTVCARCQRGLRSDALAPHLSALVQLQPGESSTPLLSPHALCTVAFYVPLSALAVMPKAAMTGDRSHAGESDGKVDPLDTALGIKFSRGLPALRVLYTVSPGGSEERGAPVPILPWPIDTRKAPLDPRVRDRDGGSPGFALGEFVFVRLPQPLYVVPPRRLPEGGHGAEGASKAEGRFKEQAGGGGDMWCEQRWAIGKIIKVLPPGRAVAEMAESREADRKEAKEKVNDEPLSFSTEADNIESFVASLMGSDSEDCSYESEEELDAFEDDLDAFSLEVEFERYMAQFIEDEGRGNNSSGSSSGKKRAEIKKKPGAKDNCPADSGDEADVSLMWRYKLELRGLPGETGRAKAVRYALLPAACLYPLDALSASDCPPQRALLPITPLSLASQITTPFSDCTAVDHRSAPVAVRQTEEVDVLASLADSTALAVLKALSVLAGSHHAFTPSLTRPVRGAASGAPTLPSPLALHLDPLPLALLPRLYQQALQSGVLGPLPSPARRGLHLSPGAETVGTRATLGGATSASTDHLMPTAAKDSKEQEEEQWREAVYLRIQQLHEGLQKASSSCSPRPFEVLPIQAPLQRSNTSLPSTTLSAPSSHPLDWH